MKLITNGKYSLLKYGTARNIATTIADNNLSDKVELAGTFCLGKCQQGVCVLVDEKFVSVAPEEVKEFFNREVLEVLNERK